MKVYKSDMKEESNSILFFLFVISCIFLNDGCKKLQLSVVQKCLCTSPEKRRTAFVFYADIKTHRNST